MRRGREDRGRRRQRALALLRRIPPKPSDLNSVYFHMNSIKTQYKLHGEADINRLIIYFAHGCLAFVILLVMKTHVQPAV